HALDHVLEKYYLTTDIPTIDYVYSLSALGAKDPNDLQPILEADTLDILLKRVEELMTINRSN
ncbi:MAG: LON domain containing protein, partial [Nitrosarchaeum sp.]|nr:LON domain containing protein [Nitrosarchaeum sp.]